MKKTNEIHEIIKWNNKIVDKTTTLTFFANEIEQ